MPTCIRPALKAGLFYGLAGSAIKSHLKLWNIIFLLQVSFFKHVKMKN